MKIFYTALSEIPSRTANSIHVMNMCEAFGRDHIVELYVPNKVIDYDDNHEFYGVESNFKIIKLWWPRIKGRGYIFALSFFATCLFKRPSMVYGRCILACAFSCLYARVKTRYEAHAPIENYDQIHRFFFKLMWRSEHFEKLIVISEALKNIYITAGVPADKILVAHDAANTNERSKRESRAANDPIRVGYFGHLYQGRGIEVVVECARQLKTLRFIIVGGSDADIAYWRSKKLPDNLTLAGFVPPKDVADFRDQCDILLAPYQEKVSINNKGDSSSYMSPLKIFEYMASAKAIVVSDLPVLREVLNSENSIMVDSKDISSWVAAIDDLSRDARLRHRIGVNALKDLESKYTWRKRVDHVLA